MEERRPIPVPPYMQHGIDLFNAGEHFEAHEVLEDVWRLQEGPERQFTQALIQIAVGSYHFNRANFVGAAKLFRKGLKRLTLFQPAYLGFDVSALVVQTDELLQAAESSVGSSLARPQLILLSGSADGNAE